MQRLPSTPALALVIALMLIGGGIGCETINQVTGQGGPESEQPAEEPEPDEPAPGEVAEAEEPTPEPLQEPNLEQVAAATGAEFTDRAIQAVEYYRQRVNGVPGAPGGLLGGRLDRTSPTAIGFWDSNRLDWLKVILGHIERDVRGTARTSDEQRQASRQRAINQLQWVDGYWADFEQHLEGRYGAEYTMVWPEFKEHATTRITQVRRGIQDLTGAEAGARDDLIGELDEMEQELQDVDEDRRARIQAMLIERLELAEHGLDALQHQAGAEPAADSIDPGSRNPNFQLLAVMDWSTFYDQARALTEHYRQQMADVSSEDVQGRLEGLESSLTDAELAIEEVAQRTEAEKQQAQRRVSEEFYAIHSGWQTLRNQYPELVGLSTPAEVELTWSQLRPQAREIFDVYRVRIAEASGANLGQAAQYHLERIEQRVRGLEEAFLTVEEDLTEEQQIERKAQLIDRLVREQEEWETFQTRHGDELQVSGT